MKRATLFFAILVAALGSVLPAQAQEHMPAKVDISFNRYYDYPELEAHYKAIAQAYPDLVELRNIGQTLQGRDMWVAIVNSKKTGPHTSKPAMWIDGNVHGNEIQSGEAVLYSLWYLTKAYGVNEDLTELLDTYSFYFLASQNPDGRQHWFDAANSAHSSRQNQRPVDNDRDGLLDEDPADDLDGDGSITGMWIEDPNGRWIRDRNDPRIFKRVAADEKGEWTRLGSEGIDNDGDGRINEDGVGGDDMNRNWPSDWQPTYIQGGAGPYPFSAPEARAVGRFILDHPNIAAVQSYHNSGGMILRGPGASYVEPMYPAEDRRVYDEIGKTGEDILPYYRYMVIYKDLYTVHGGFVTWTAEGLGIFSFTNELWSNSKYFQRDMNRPDDERMWLFRDRLAFGQQFTDYTEYDHPQHGKVLVGGLNKWSSRNTPTFMLEEECHRNFAFTMFHADQMAQVRFDRTEIKNIGDGLWQITTEIKNDNVMPTRSGIQRRNGIGPNDLLLCEPAGDGSVVASGTLRTWRDLQMNEVRDEPGRIQLAGGIPGRGGTIFRFLVTGKAGDKVTLRFEAQKAKNIQATVTLDENASD